MSGKGVVATLCGLVGLLLSTYRYSAQRSVADTQQSLRIELAFWLRGYLAVFTVIMKSD